MLSFRVAQKFQKGPEQVIAQFKDVPTAKLFIQAKLEADTMYRVEATYLLYDFDDVMEEFLPGSGQSNESSSSDQGAGQSNTQVFSPSPFQMAPKPGGVPPSSFKDLIKKDDETK